MEPTQQGIIRWSAHRANDHLQAVVPASIGIPLIAIIAGQFIALPAKPTTADRIIQGVESLGVGVLIVALLVFIYAILVAPYEQRNALRRQMVNAANEIKELRGSIREALQLREISTNRGVANISNPDRYNKLWFIMYFRNTASIPIKYSLRELTVELNGRATPDIAFSNDSYRVSTGSDDQYHFEINVDPPQHGQVNCIVSYTARYGPTTDPYMYEQQYRIYCTNSTTIDPGRGASF